MTVNPFPRLWRMDTRPVEIMIATLILVRGIILALPGEAMSAVYAPSLAIASEGVWAAGTIAGAIIQLAGIYINGWWVRSPVLRTTGMFIGLFINLYLSATFILLGTGPALLAGGVYLTLVVFALWCICHISAHSERRDQAAGPTE